MQTNFDIREMLTMEEQMSEALLLSLMLAFSGGFQDAYTYFVRDHVYANAQTGNLVLMSTHFMNREWGEAWSYLFPLLAFALGVFAAENIHQVAEHKRGKIHWRQWVIAAEALIMLVVGFISTDHNRIANCLVSFACAMQVQSFRTVHGYAYASTMCIGNLRGAMSALGNYVHLRDQAYLRRALYYGLVILAFALGAGMGGVITPEVGIRASWICAVLLLVGYWLMGWKGRTLPPRKSRSGE